MSIELTLHDYDSITIENADKHCYPNAANNHYDVLTFRKGNKTILIVNLHYSDVCRSRLLVAPHFKLPVKSDRGPYLLPLPYGEVSEDCDTCYVDWHFEHPDGVICVDKVFNVYGDQIPDITLTEEMHGSLVEQIIEYLEKQPAPYTGD